MYLTVKDLAKYLNCSQSLVRRLVREKKIKFFRLGSRITFSSDDVYQYILEQEKIALSNV